MSYILAIAKGGHVSYILAIDRGHVSYILAIVRGPCKLYTSNRQGAM